MLHVVTYHTKNEEGQAIVVIEELNCTKALGQSGPFMVFHQEETEVYINMGDIIRLERPTSRIATVQPTIVGG